MRSHARSLLPVGWALAAIACEGVSADLAPLPEALVVVDTNLPVPLAVGRMRVDLYGADGTWFESRNFSRASASDWPVSFSVFADAARARAVWVRLRVFPEGQTSRYLGERFRGWDAPFAAPAGDGAPRLIVGGVDRTPTEEPVPLVTVDRLIKIELAAGTRGRVSVLLHGACVGTMSKLGEGGRPGTDSASCIDQEKTLAPIVALPVEATMARPTVTAVGTWLSEPCPGEADPESSAVCIPGGTTMLGSTENSYYVQSESSSLDSMPVRIFGLRRFWIDRNEMTVARARALIGGGYTGARPDRNEGPLGSNIATGEDCTYSAEPRGREEYPLTCAPWAVARALCNFAGGDLPTEAQWEHVATVAGHPTKRRFPWGNETPACGDAVFDRNDHGGGTGKCGALGTGPRPFSEGPRDVSPLGVQSLFGSVQEWASDDATAFTDPCWATTSIVSPACPARAGAARHVSRGTGYGLAASRPSDRRAVVTSFGYGVRCAYAERPR